MLERRTSELTKWKLTLRRRGEVQEPWSERVAHAADVHQEAVGLQRRDHAVGGRLGEPGRVRDGGERSRAVLDGVQDVDRPVEDADAGCGCGAPRGGKAVTDVAFVLGPQRPPGLVLDRFRHRCFAPFRGRQWTRRLDRGSRGDPPAEPATLLSTIWN